MCIPNDEGYAPGPIFLRRWIRESLIMQYGGEGLTTPEPLVGDTERVSRAACGWVQVHHKKQSGQVKAHDQVAIHLRPVRVVPLSSDGTACKTLTATQSSRISDRTLSTSFPVFSAQIMMIAAMSWSPLPVTEMFDVNLASSREYMSSADPSPTPVSLAHLSNPIPWCLIQ